MFELKKISREAIPAALARAERYRLLNQPRQAESICLDILRTEPGNQAALVTLLLSCTEQFGKPGHKAGLKEVQDMLAGIASEYERVYYEGVISERWGKALLSGKAPAYVAVGWLRQAMTLFEKAEGIRPPGNDDPILRWNACARLIMQLEASGPVEADAEGEVGFGFDAPPS